jgi:ATPase family associated with various cellular activities (AAA)
MDFNGLRAERQALNDAVLLHEASVAPFRAGDLPWFRLNLSEVADPQDPLRVRHLSTSASCLESLADVPAHQVAYADAAKTLGEVVDPFAKGALERRPEAWESEGAAEIYCRVRTLPIIFAQASDAVLQPFAQALHDHVVFVWDRLVPDDPEAQGISELVKQRQLKLAAAGETTSDGPPGEHNAEEEQGGEEEQHYPPNAFHTYWALRLLHDYSRRADALALPDLPENLALKRAVALLWCSRTLSAQAALISSEAERLDAQQLAWALLADYEGRLHTAEDPEQPVTAASERRELYTAALDAFFHEQNPGGGWPLYEPLFHYPQAGNAYCYAFETLAELLRPALRRRDGRLLRDLLLPHLSKLIDAKRFAERTAVDLPGGGMAWSSGHHPHRRQPEAWSTALVFSYLQNLRRLVGHWTADAASRALGARSPQYSRPEEGMDTLRDRAVTWTDEEHPLSVGRELAGLFVHPVRRWGTRPTEIEPDSPLVGKDEARSAILFGPPGTGKNTFVEALAGAIEWDFVDVPASAFVKGGMDQVPARAEEIFTQLMELDRCVVLFDEVDELIRERRSEASDPFGRFLTTSMLPKLAKLWAQRRVLFFVATNNIDKADPAIRRSQRFDAAIFMAPPSFEVKRTLLKEHLGGEPPNELTLELVEGALSKTLEEEPVGAFALLRWDQIPELANLARQRADGSEVTLRNLTDALRKMGEELARLEYADEDDEHKPREVFDVWRRFWTDARRDFGRPVVARIVDAPDPTPEAWPAVARLGDDVYIDLRRIESATSYPGDSCEISIEGYEGEDDRILNFQQDGGTDGTATATNAVAPQGDGPVSET